MRKEKMTFKMQLSFSQKLDLSKFSLSLQKMQKLSGDDDQQMKRQNCLKIKKTVKFVQRKWEIKWAEIFMSPN